jgi:6-pyruvoyl-tetrahydropterin synthase
MAELGYTVFVEAAHGKEPHGHNFKVEIVLEAAYDSKTGFVAKIDVNDFMLSVENFRKELDHKNLNKMFNPASMENIAKFFIEKLEKRFPVKFVKVFENENRYAMIYSKEISL